MTGPAWLTAAFAALMLTVAAYCATRLAAARPLGKPTHVDTDAAHIIMGTAMAGMLVARLRILPAQAWEPVFALGAAWFAWQLIQARRTASPWRCLHPAPHLAECAAMLYMFLAVPKAPMATAMSGTRSPVPALLLAVFMLAYAARTADRLTAPADPPARSLLAPRCAALCKIAMGLTMGYTLVLML